MPIGLQFPRELASSNERRLMELIRDRLAPIGTPYRQVS